MLQSLTADGRIHQKLRAFSDKIPDFLEYVKSQGPDFIRQLKVPVFSNSLLLNANVNRSDKPQAGTPYTPMSRQESAVNDSFARKPFTDKQSGAYSALELGGLGPK